MIDKYFLLTPFPAGFSNVIMSYEIGFAIAHITNRKIILPPTSWCVLIDDRDSKPQQWQDIWEVYDKEIAKQHFDIIDLFEFNEFKPIIEQLTAYDKASNRHYSWYRDKQYINDYAEFAPFINSNICIYNSQQNYPGEDFFNFSKNRPLVDVNKEEKFISTSGFGHYWYQVYPGNSSERNKMKKRINNSFQFKEKYYTMAKSALATLKLNKFNAIHVRSPWQLMYDDQPEKTINFRENKKAMLNQCRILFDTDKPLYVSTDIEFKEFFNELKAEYKIIFQEDLGLLNLTPLEKIAIDNIICLYADTFHGSYFSTFSKRIHILRAINNKKDFDFMGFNKITNYERNSKDPFPWNNEKDNLWNWYKDSYLQWTFE